MNSDLASSIAHDNGVWHNGNGVAHEVAAPAPLLAVLWRRRTTLAVTVVMFIAAAVLYLLVAKRIYRSTSEVFINQDEPQVFSNRQTPVLRSDEFLNTQAAVMQSAPVLARALATLAPQQLKTFENIQGDPVDWLQRAGSGLDVEPQRKTDVIEVSMDTKYQFEAPLIANAVVDAYIAEAAHQKHALGDAMNNMLLAQRDALGKQIDVDLLEMLKLKQEAGVLSFNDDRGNTVLGKASLLATSLATFQLSIVDLRSELDAAKTVLGNPSLIHPFVEGEWLKGQQLGGKELEDCQTQLTQLTLASAELTGLLGHNNPRVVMYDQDVQVLKQRIAEKERDAVESLVQNIPIELAAAQGKESELQAQVDEQKETGSDLNIKAAQYARLEADHDRLQKQCDVLDGRIAEVAVNDANNGALGVQVVEPARVEERPIKPNKPLVLATAGVFGWLVGIGLALMAEWNDTRLRTPDEIMQSLGVSIIGSAPSGLRDLAGPRLPRGSARAALPGRGGRSSAPVLADAFREMSAAILRGPARHTKTLLVTSPSRGDGRSTVVGQLALGFAQEGLRTLVLDCDLSNPSQDKIFGVEANPGFCSVLKGGEKLAYAVRTTQQDELYVMPCGLAEGEAADQSIGSLLGKRFDDVMQLLRNTFDRIIIDSPALTDADDGLRLAGMADATLLVLRMNRSSQKLAAAMLDELFEAGANVLGVVANDVPLTQHRQLIGFTRPSAPPLRAAPQMAVPGAVSNAAGLGAMNGGRPGHDFAHRGPRLGSALSAVPGAWAQESR
jgi:capsular exopolysaccharide synthesis family protein